MSLDVLESTTKDLCQRLRDFESATCAAFETCELKREAEARQRRQTKVATVTQHHDNAAATTPGTTVTDQRNMARVRKKFNLNTYKNHSLGGYEFEPFECMAPLTPIQLNPFLGDYVLTIQMYGTTDSYSTEPVSSFYLSEIG